ncbi:helix-turn-helix domain-containing protein [Chitinophaga silvisoli]|uniref:XRE family transcriptional regulator n=1 Tax=Chitinophaga silvisoli TaxID=2291814 RepID=A0A3E1NXD0_9BACT|nr:helix-turn-helix transcriptional regulator [Chitinophaga silvisoli]RFM32418.1 XRE family transcriptional regulator [Chitinophaga silvisoli]
MTIALMDEDVKIVHNLIRQRFKLRRKELKLSIRKLAAAAGVEYSLIDEFERKGRDIRLSSFIAIALALQIDPLQAVKDEGADK